MRLTTRHFLLLLPPAINAFPQAVPDGAPQVTAPAEFVPNPNVGGGGRAFKDSPHFRIYGVSSTQADAAISMLEAAYSCFVNDLGWRSSGLSYNTASNNGPFYKTNIYGVGSLGGAAGQMFSDARSGLSYLKVGIPYISDPKVTVHEYGHSLAYHERSWVEQTRTGAWWETVAQFVADTYLTSPLCAAARQKYNQPEGKTLMELNKVISDAHQVIVDGSPNSGNYYQAWPFLTYLTNNPDDVEGLGATALREMFRQYKQKSNETPLHVLERVSKGASVQKLVGRYWARMAFVDIGHPQAQQLYTAGKTRFNYANLDAAGSGSYDVKADRAPRYMGANIIPLKSSGGAVTVKISSDAPLTATLAVKSQAGAVKYTDLINGTGQASIAAGDAAALVVANTPAELLMYDGFEISGEVAKGVSYHVDLTGATA